MSNEPFIEDEDEDEIEDIQVTTVETTTINYKNGEKTVTDKTMIGPCTNPNRPC